MRLKSAPLRWGKAIPVDPSGTRRQVPDTKHRSNSRTATPPGLPTAGIRRLPAARCIGPQTTLSRLSHDRPPKVASTHMDIALIVATGSPTYSARFRIWALSARTVENTSAIKSMNAIARLAADDSPHKGSGSAPAVRHVRPATIPGCHSPIPRRTVIELHSFDKTHF